MDTITKGRLGYNLVEKELLKRGFELYIPLLENTKIDCIAIKNNNLFRIQIKIFINSNNRKYLPVRKISHNQGNYKIHLYNSKEIDYFFGVDLEEESVYVIPISFIEKYSSSISINTLVSYKDNFNLLEPCTGNNTSADDDIGEN